MSPVVSIVVPVHNQVQRLRLSLIGLARQDGVEPEQGEVIIVDDGSTDDLDRLLATVRPGFPHRLRKLQCSSGGSRGVPRNLGAAASEGDLVIFLDADACPSRGLVARHLRAHHVVSTRIALGECRVVSDVQRFLDPAVGTPFPQFEGMPAASRSQLISPEELHEDGADSLDGRSRRGIYPGMGHWQRQLEELLSAGARTMAWAGAIPHNLSMRRQTFLGLGGFSHELRHAEGWELGLRAQAADCELVFAHGARSYHLYHGRLSQAQGSETIAAYRALSKAFPDRGVEAVVLWTACVLGDPYVPSELGLNDWRTVAALAPSDDRIARIYSAFMSMHESPSLFDYLTCRAINSPLKAVGVCS